MRKCQKCKQEKPVDAFYRCFARKDGLQSRCKQCQHVDTAARQKNNPEKYNAYKREWLKKNPEEFKAMCRRNKASVCERLADSYVRDLLAKLLGCLNAEVPAALVEAKRELVKLKRKIKEQRDANQQPE